MRAAPPAFSTTSRNTSSSDGATTVDATSTGDARAAAARRERRRRRRRATRSTACTAVPKRLVFSTSGIASSARIAVDRLRRATSTIGRPAKTCFSSLDGAERRQPAGVDDRDAVAVLGLVQVVRRDEHGDARLRRASSISRQNCRRDSGSTPPVGSSRNTIGGSWRIAQPSARRWRQPPGRSRVSVCSRPRRPAISSTNARRAASRSAVEPVDAAEEADVLIDGQQLVEREPLRHVADALLHAFGIARDVDAADERRAGRRPQQAAQHADGRRLAGAVAAEEAEDLAARARRTTRRRRRRTAPNRRVRSRTSMASASRRWHRRLVVIGRPRASSRASASRTLASARVRSSSACSSAGLRVEHVGAGRDAGAEALADDAARLGGARGRRRRPRRSRRGSSPARAGAAAPRTRPGDRTRRRAPARRARRRRGFGPLGAARGRRPTATSSR